MKGKTKLLMNFKKIKKMLILMVEMLQKEI
jgi:hypothetical protein